MQTWSAGMSWTLNQIWVYPIKSLPGVSVNQSEILPAGGLLHDREFALFDGEGKVVNAKRTAAFHRIRADWYLADWSVRLSTASALTSSDPITFHLDRDREKLTDWLSLVLGMPTRIEQRTAGGFPDDDVATGPTMISAATLTEVAQWFPGLSMNDVRHRFRANLELDGAEPFCEDRLFGAAGETLKFQIGEATLVGTNPCQRCVVPTRSSQTGEIWPRFQKTFAEKRRATLPPWADESCFDHFYRLAVNTRSTVAQRQAIRTGDEVKAR
jgi:uncharacterized protein YcbX